MRLYHQLLLFMLAATVLPLSLLGFSLLSRSERELTGRIAGEQQALSALALERVADPLRRAMEGFSRAAALIDFSAATEEEAKGGLSLLYQQSPLFSATALVSGQRAILAGPIYASSPEAGRARFDPADLAAWLRSFSDEALLHSKPGEPIWGEPYVRVGGEVALPLAIRVGSVKPMFVSAEVCLFTLREGLRAQDGQRQKLLILDGSGRTLLSSEDEPALQKVPIPNGSWRWTEQSPDGPMLWARAGPDEKLGLLALAVAPKAQVLRAVALMRREVLASLAGALGVLLFLGWAFTRRIQRRLEQVVAGAEALGRGELSTRLPETGQDELAELSISFNHMGQQLEAAYVRLSRWNEDLRVRVDEATSELREAQAQLAEAQKLAAVGQLGAGVAHEINNPLAGILGHTQLLMLDRREADPDFQTLQKIEQSAKRCKEITQTLLRFSQQDERTHLRPIDLNAVVRDALSLSSSQLKGEGVELLSELHPRALTILGDPGQLSQVLLALISNARVAMQSSASKKLWVKISTDGDFALLTVRDSGKGILPEHLPRIFEPFFTTKDVWSNVGLGLSVSFRVVSEHQGKIDVESRPGEGATFTVRLPMQILAQSVPTAGQGQCEGSHPSTEVTS